MRTLGFLLACGLIVGCAFWAYRVNYETQQAENRVEALQRAIIKEKQAIAMLNAEWAWLNRPDRLRDLAEAHFKELNLQPLGPEHFGEAMTVAYPLQPDMLRNLVDTSAAEAGQ